MAAPILVARNEVNRNSEFLEDLEHADVGPTLGSTTA